MTTRNSIAAHEAGHAILAWFCKSLILVELRVGGAKNHVIYSTPNPVTAELAWENLLAVLGGIAGQFRSRFRTHGSESGRDLEQARRLAESIVIQLVLRGVPVSVAFPVDVSDRATISRMFHDEPSKPVRHVLEAAYLKARLVLHVYDIEFRALRRALRFRDHFTPKEVELLIGRSPAAKLVARGFFRRSAARFVSWLRFLHWLRARHHIRVEQNVAPVLTNNVSHDSSSSSSNASRRSKR
jgi:hypothetical protein